MKKLMKHFILAAIAVSMAAGFSSCEKDNEDETIKNDAVEYCYNSLGKSMATVCGELESQGYICGNTITDEVTNSRMFDYYKENGGSDVRVFNVCVKNNIVVGMRQEELFEAEIDNNYIRETHLAQVRACERLINPDQVDADLYWNTVANGDSEGEYHSVTGYIKAWQDLFFDDDCWAEGGCDMQNTKTNYFMSCFAETNDGIEVIILYKDCRAIWNNLW